MPSIVMYPLFNLWSGAFATRITCTVSQRFINSIKYTFEFNLQDLCISSSNIFQWLCYQAFKIFYSVVYFSILHLSVYCCIKCRLLLMSKTATKYWDYILLLLMPGKLSKDLPLHSERGWIMKYVPSLLSSHNLNCFPQLFFTSILTYFNCWYLLFYNT